MKKASSGCLEPDNAYLVCSKQLDIKMMQKRPGGDFLAERYFAEEMYNEQDNFEDVICKRGIQTSSSMGKIGMKSDKKWNLFLWFKIIFAANW